IGTFCRAKIHGNAVLNDFVLLQNLIQDAQRPPAIDHEVLGDYFEPIHYRFARQNMVVMRCAQTNPDAVVRKIVKTICWHSLLRSLKGDVEGRYDPKPAPDRRKLSLSYSGILEPSVAQPPLPLQEFLPLQPLSLDLHPPLPLQEFWPLQACFSFTFLSAFLSALSSWAVIADLTPGSRLEALMLALVP